MSSRASARFPTALAGTKPCAEAWEGLRRGLGGTAPRPGRDCGPGILRLHGSRARLGPAPDGTCSTDGPVGPARPALHSPDSGGV